MIENERCTNIEGMGCEATNSLGFFVYLQVLKSGKKAARLSSVLRFIFTLYRIIHFFLRFSSEWPSRSANRETSRSSIAASPRRMRFLATGFLVTLENKGEVVRPEVVIVAETL